MAFMLLTHLTLIKVSISNPKLFWLEQWKLSQLLHPDIKPVPFLSLASEWGTLLGPSRLWCFYRLTSIVVHSSRGFLNGGSSSKHTSVKRKGWNFCTFTRVTWLFWSEKNHRYPPLFYSNFSYFLGICYGWGKLLISQLPLICSNNWYIAFCLKMNIVGSVPGVYNKNIQ